MTEELPDIDGSIVVMMAQNQIQTSRPHDSASIANIQKG